jgi:dolichol-phosphate mannosyltransferase
MELKKPSLDIVSSALNEGYNIRNFYSALSNNLNKSGYKWRLLIADNGSDDDTWEIIKELANENSNVVGIKLSRNFGFEYAIEAVLKHSTADASIIMASDLQDHPKYLHIFLNHFESGADHIFQIVKSRPGIRITRRINTKIFYYLASKLSRGAIVPNAGDFRLISKKFRDALHEMPEKTRFLRAMSIYPGFKNVSLEIPRENRTKGKSKTNLTYALTLGIKGVLANSIYLIDILGLFSMLFSIFTFLLILIFTIFWIFIGVPFGGFGTIVGIMLVGFSLVFICFGILAQYISLIYVEVKRRPSYFISEVI